jgi:hypothetical protein
VFNRDRKIKQKAKVDSKKGKWHLYTVSDVDVCLKEMLDQSINSEGQKHQSSSFPHNQLFLTLYIPKCFLTKILDAF